MCTWISVKLSGLSSTYLKFAGNSYERASEQEFINFFEDNLILSVFHKGAFWKLLDKISFPHRRENTFNNWSYFENSVWSRKVGGLCTRNLCNILINFFFSYFVRKEFTFESTRFHNMYFTLFYIILIFITLSTKHELKTIWKPPHLKSDYCNVQLEGYTWYFYVRV